MHPLFLEPITEYSVIELALWILRCREAISLDSDSQTLQDIEYFCLGWEEHHHNNIEFYKSDKYKKAILLTGRIPKYSFRMDYGKGHETISNIFQNLSSSARLWQSNNEMAISTLNDDLKFYKTGFDQCFRDNYTYKQALYEIVSQQYFMQPYIRVRVFKNRKWFKTATYAEFLKECENSNQYELDYQKRELKSSYITSLSDFGITKTIFFDFINGLEKEFDKKLFINLAFALSLPYNYFDKLLKYNGLSFKDSSRQFDIICEKAFRIGFGREYTQALIMKYNKDRLAVNPKFVPVPII